MSKGSILVVDDDFDISRMLKIYFSGLGYSVDVVTNGEDAISLAHEQLPNIILLEVKLPDMSGYEVCRELRSTTSTKHIPIIFLTWKEHRSYEIGIELGRDDYITKPFDIEEVKLRIVNNIRRVETLDRINSTSGFPTGASIEEPLIDLMRKESDWHYIDIKITNFDPFREVYGWQARDEVIRAIALMITEVLEQHGTKDDFAGHPGSDNFVFVTHVLTIDTLQEALAERFSTEIQQHYSFIDRDRGYMLHGDEQKDFMTLSIGSVSTQTHQFSDLREMVELAADDRRSKFGGDTSGNDGCNDILASW